MAMRKTLTILAVLGFAIGISARTASADGGVDYTVTGSFATGSDFSSTALSNPGDSFTFTFSVNPTQLGSGPIGGEAVTIPLTGGFNFTESSGPNLTAYPGTVTFNTLASNPPGLFDIDFTFGGDMYILQLTGVNPGFVDGTPPSLSTGVFTITPGPPSGSPDVGTGSLFGDFNTGNFAAVSGTVTATGTGTTVPEPSSLLLLGSGSLALGAFARKRLFARGN